MVTLPDPAQLRWTQPEWRAEAMEWIEEQLGARGIVRTGAIEQPHVRPWSTVMRVPTEAGDLYFKAAAASQAHEVPLGVILWRLRPSDVVEVLAADIPRAWMLMRDGGRRLRDLIVAKADLGQWETVIDQYAHLQLGLASHAGEFIARGVPDRRLAALPSLYDDLLSDETATRVGQPEGLTAEEHARLRHLSERVRDMARELGSHAVPETLQHDDLHDGNVLVSERGHVIFDWGDSCISHPFYSLVVTMRSIAHRFELAPDAPELMVLRTRYLEPWAAYERMGDLLRAFAVAQRLGIICRALTWHAVIAAMDADVAEGYADVRPDNLRRFLSAEADGG